MSIYEKAVSMLPADCIDHHESDLYIKRTPKSSELVKCYEYRTIVEIFRSQLDGCIWFDIPFGYDPYWAELHKSGTCGPVEHTPAPQKEGTNQ